jgi:hypothetical protein
VAFSFPRFIVNWTCLEHDWRSVEYFPDGSKELGAISMRHYRSLGWKISGLHRPSPRENDSSNKWLYQEPRCSYSLLTSFVNIIFSWNFHQLLTAKQYSFCENVSKIGEEFLSISVFYGYQYIFRNHSCSIGQRLAVLLVGLHKTLRIYTYIQVVLKKTAHAITLLLMTQMKKNIQEIKWL